MVSSGEPRTALVFGASSQIGVFLLRRLVARGDEVLAVSRKNHASGGGITWLHGDLTTSLPDLPRTPSLVVSFGPLDHFARWLAHAPLAAGAFVVATSSMSAESKVDSPVLAEQELARRLQAGEQQLARACEQRGLPWTILRPTIVYGAGLDKSLTPMARRAVRLRVFPWPQGRGMRQPVHADDIAQAALAAADSGACAGRIVPIGGGERLTAGQMFDRVRRSLPIGVVPVPLPTWGLDVLAMGVPWIRGPVARLRSDLVADNTVLQERLGVFPRPFRPDPACWGL